MRSMSMCSSPSSAALHQYSPALFRLTWPRGGDVSACGTRGRARRPGHELGHLAPRSSRRMVPQVRHHPQPLGCQDPSHSHRGSEPPAAHASPDSLPGPPGQRDPKCALLPTCLCRPLLATPPRLTFAASKAATCLLPSGGPGTRGLSQPRVSPPTTPSPAPCPAPHPGQTSPDLRPPHGTRLSVRGSTPPSLITAWEGGPWGQKN